MRKHAWRRNIAAVATILVTVTGVAACGSDDSADSASKTVGFSVLNARDPDLAVMTKAMQAQATKDGLDLSVVDAKGETSTELTQIEDLITKKVSAIIMMPIDGKGSQAAAKRVNEAGIPLFILSTEFADGADVEKKSYIGVDDTEAGRMQGDYLNEQLPEGGKMIYLVGTYGASWTDRRKKGFMEKKNDNIKIVSELQANGDRAEAKRITEDLLGKFPKGEVNALVAHNDEMAIGAAQAIKEAGRQGDIKIIVGVDGTAPGVQAIADGEMSATVLQRSAEQGQKAVDVVGQSLDGEEVDASYTLPFKLVTSENVADFQ